MYVKIGLREVKIMDLSKNKLRRTLASVCAVVCAAAAVPVVSVSAAATKYEAENATFTNSSVSVVSKSGCSGGKCVSINTTNPNAMLSFNVNAAETGVYKIVVRASGNGGDKVNRLRVDKSVVGEFTSTADKMNDATLDMVYMTKGSHTVHIMPSWGYIDVDYITVEKSETKDYSKGITRTLINPDASDKAKRLMAFLADNFGKNTIAGQQADGTGGKGYGLTSGEFTAIHDLTGRYPALIGLDLMNSYNVVEAAKEIDAQNGIVSLCYHWRAPAKYVKEGNDSNGNPNSWGAFYTDHLTGFNFDDIMNGKDQEGYDLLMGQLDKIAPTLVALRDANIPVLFRPLHEGSGGWFWWGSGSAESYKKLWKIMYDKFTNEYGCNNLIWVYNGQDKDWYPGDEYVDIIGEDIYPGKHVYKSQASKFNEAFNYTDAKKITTLSENGCLFNPYEAGQIGTMWSWFCVWNGDFVQKNSAISTTYTDKYMWKYVYNHANVITLDEMPDIATYPLDGSAAVKSKDGDFSAELVLGDVNGDSSVNTKDAMVMIQYAAGKKKVKDDLAMLAADINSSGNVDTKDAMALIQFVKGAKANLP